MKKELIDKLCAADVERLHEAYTKIAVVYENMCGGPYKAKEHKEYFAVMNTREYLRKRFMELTCKR